MADNTPAPTAAQTVAQAAAWRSFARKYDEDGWPPARVTLNEGFEAGAAWMLERVLQAAPCETCEQDVRRCTYGRELPAWLTALCASITGKESAHDDPG